MFVANGESQEPIRRWAIPGGGERTGGWGENSSISYPNGPLAFSPDGHILATAFLKQFNDGERHESVVVLWDAKKAREHGQLRASPRSPHAESLAFSPDGKLLAGIYGPDLIVWDVAARKEVARHQPSKKHFKGLAFTPDGTRLLTASNEESIRVWVAPTWAEATGYAWKVGKLGCVAVSADGTLAAAGGSTGKVVVWDLD